MFTLSGGHVFPLYDGAVHASPPMRLVDVRHEQTAVFAAEATARLTRSPGLAVLTAGPGVTNGVSAITTAHFNGSPVVVLGGPGAGLPLGLGQPAGTRPSAAARARSPSGPGPSTTPPRSRPPWTEAFWLASTPHRGPVFLDIALEALFGQAGPVAPAAPRPAAADSAPLADPDAISQIAGLIAAARRPVLVLGSDVWAGPRRRRGPDRGRGPAAAGDHQRPGPRHPAARPSVAGHPRPLGRAAPRRTWSWWRVPRWTSGSVTGCSVSDNRATHRRGSHRRLPRAGRGALPAGRLRTPVTWPPFFAGLADPAAWPDGRTSCPGRTHGCRCSRTRWPRRWPRTPRLLASAADPIHPLRIYGELARLLDDDAVVIGDGGDFVSYAGKYIEPQRPGGWLDPGPYGCLGTGLGYAIAARLARPVGPGGAAARGRRGRVLADGHRHAGPPRAAGRDDLRQQRHLGPGEAPDAGDLRLRRGRRPAAADCRYDEVVEALGGAGETGHQARRDRPGAAAGVRRRCARTWST